MNQIKDSNNGLCILILLKKSKLRVLKKLSKKLTVTQHLYPVRAYALAQPYIAELKRYIEQLRAKHD